MSSPLRKFIRETIRVYGLGRIDVMDGGPGEMFKMGVDYKNAGTNVPHGRQGYVDRSHPMPYTITVLSDIPARELYKKYFEQGITTDYIDMVPDQPFFGPDGVRIEAHVATGSNTADAKDVKLIQDELYKYVESILSTPEGSNFIINVRAVPDKIRY